MIPPTMDATALPPRFSTGDPGSFAEKTLRIRLPDQIDQLLELHSPYHGGRRLRRRGGDDTRHPVGRRFPPRGEAPPDRAEATAGLKALKRRLEGGVVRDLLREQPEVAEAMAPSERADWERSIGAQAGRPWNALPFYFAESLFYLEVLAAWGYYTPGSPGFGQDPYESLKARELSRDHGGIARAQQILAHLATLSGPEDRITALLLHALWGNRMDLTFNELVERYGSGVPGAGEELLIDHSPMMARKALSARRVDLVVDNAGTELVCDLLLSHALLDRGVNVVLHLKNSPFYVSDAMAKDVETSVAVLADCPDEPTARVGRQLQDALKNRALIMRPHWYWNGPLLYPQWHEDIRRELAESNLILFKGDVNYRRLLDDRRWDPETPMEELTAYVPSVFGVLRTLKSEVLVDLARETIAKISRGDPEWSVRGHYGLARLRD
jgi:uncharacterized protein with ATP-grasp and redox domains